MSDWVAFCDGACSGNPGPGGWASLVWNVELDLVTELGGGEKTTTNNRMEMIAARQALRYFIDKADVERDRLWLVSDSSYVVRGIEDWIPKWKTKNWQKADGQDVANQDLWRELDELSGSVENLELVHIMGHSGVAENERVDEIAVAFSKDAPIKLFSGGRCDHPSQRIFETRNDSIPVWLKKIQSHSQTRPAKKSSGTSKGPGYYVSVVKGEVQTHAQWSECEKRVKGVSGAKFKKVKNQEEESSFLASLGSNAFRK
jgi:ribonuclease HI